MQGYVKLFSSILSSSVWREDAPTKVVWVTLLALSDRNGEVSAAVPGLAHMAGVSIPECQAALAKFLAPDEYSRTREHEGRRIEPIDGGWRLLNHAKYREKMRSAERQEYNREIQRKVRAKARLACGHPADGSVPGLQTPEPVPAAPAPDPIFDGMQEAPPARPAPSPSVRDDWFQWRLAHPRIYIGRTGEDGDLAAWRGLLEECGAPCLSQVYDSMVAGLTPDKRLFYNAVADYVTAHTKPV